MKQVPKVAIVLLFLNDLFGTSLASAQHPKHEHKEAHAAHQTPKPEHPHHPTHAEPTKKKADGAVKHAAKKEEHGKGTDKNHEHAAQEKKKEEHAKKDAQKKYQHTAQEKRIVESLHKIVANLHRADHDYDNQRHEALEHVRSALHDLHAPDPGATGRFGDMTQAKSDAILRDALGPLKMVRAELSAKGAPVHHRAALRKIDEAVAKIHDALRIR